MTTSDYMRNQAVNISTLKELWSRSPLHYRHLLDNPRESTPAMALGTAVHMCVLEPDRFRDTYTIKPSWVKGNTKDGKAWLAEHDGLELISERDHARCLEIRRMLLAHPVAGRLLREGGDAELPIYWTDEETRVPCKGRLDLFGPRATVGLKTARSASPGPFPQQAAKLGYHLQWAFYHDGLIASGRDPGEMVEIVVEPEPPHDVVVYVIDDDTLDAGRDEYRRALVTLTYCREHNDWPGTAPLEEVVFRLPKWAQLQDDDDMSDLEWEVTQ